MGFLRVRPSLLRSNYRIILDKDHDIAGVYPIAVDGSIDPANSFSFVSEHAESLFCTQIAAMSTAKYSKMSGYEWWHRRLGHNPNASIRKSIAHSFCMDELKSARFCNHEKCPACAMGKAQRKNLPKWEAGAQMWISMDLASSSVVSLEGYKYALVIIDCCTGYRWLYGLKTKDKTLKDVQKWYTFTVTL